MMAQNFMQIETENLLLMECVSVENDENLPATRVASPEDQNQHAQYLFISNFSHESGDTSFENYDNSATKFSGLKTNTVNQTDKEIVLAGTADESATPICTVVDDPKLNNNNHFLTNDPNIESSVPSVTVPCDQSFDGAKHAGLRVEPTSSGLLLSGFNEATTTCAKPRVTLVKVPNMKGNKIMPICMGAETKPIEPVKNRFLCEVCGRCFAQTSTLRQHMKSVHTQNILNQMDESLFDNSAIMEQYVASNNDESVDTTTDKELHCNEGEPECFLCQLCNCTFATSSHVMSHFTSVHKSNPSYICGDCGKHCTSLEILNAHVQAHHRRKCVCDICGKFYSSKYYLKLHSKVHLQAKDFICNHCNKAFIDHQALQLHLRIHSGERPFECSVCNRAFIQSSHLTTHMRVHTGEKPYHCSICSKAFRQLSNVMEHERIHWK